jgi:hypothetical protein
LYDDREATMVAYIECIILSPYVHPFFLDWLKFAE